MEQVTESFANPSKALRFKVFCKKMKWRSDSKPVVIVIGRMRDHDDNLNLETPVKTERMSQKQERACAGRSMGVTIYPFDRHLISILFQALRKYISNASMYKSAQKSPALVKLRFIEED